MGNCFSDTNSSLAANAIELSLSAADLIHPDVLYKRHPMAVLYIKGSDGSLQELGRTEVVFNSSTPKWITKFTLTYKFETVQNLVFRVYDVDTQFHGLDVKALELEEQQFHGEASCTLSEIGTSTLNLALEEVHDEESPSESSEEKVTSNPRILISKVQRRHCGFMASFTGLVEKVTSILISMVQRQSQPLLPVTNTDSQLLIQNMQKLELGKHALTHATTATLGLIFSQKLQEASPHYLIIVGFMVSSMVLYNGIVFGAVNPHLGNILQLLGITLILCLLCVLVGSFLPLDFSLACWLCAAFCLMPFLYILIKPHPGTYLQRFEG